jgi:hypothetical protein
MELYALSTAVVGTANSSLGKAFTNYLYTKYMSWKLKKRLHAVVLLKGVSTLCQKFSSAEILFLDVDVLYEQLTAPKEASDVGLSKNKKYKLNYAGVDFGSQPYGDFIIYSLLSRIGGDPTYTREYAKMKRDAYLERSAKIRGDWMSDPLSQNNLARKIIW